VLLLHNLPFSWMCVEPNLPTTPRCRDWFYLKTATSRVPVPPCSRTPTCGQWLDCHPP
jgi:hypothetical protein